jgi:putative flippase GtrA
MFSSYFVVSVITLGIDWLCLVTLTSIAHVEAGAAAVVGYLAGGVVNYVLSRRFVFRSVATGSSQVREGLLFALSCGLGALLTGAVVHVSGPVLGAFFAKALAISVSVGTLYWVRRLVVFKGRPQASGQ